MTAIAAPANLNDVQEIENLVMSMNKDDNEKHKLRQLDNTTTCADEQIENVFNSSLDDSQMKRGFLTGLAMAALIVVVTNSFAIFLLKSTEVSIQYNLENKNTLLNVPTSLFYLKFLSILNCIQYIGILCMILAVKSKYFDILFNDVQYSSTSQEFVTTKEQHTGSQERQEEENFNQEKQEEEKFDQEKQEEEKFDQEKQDDIDKICEDYIIC
ncbi:unnamed protein product [Rotaria sordida]|uniref:Transmembrane protein n=1 Tax=Rotaria sordida TaxID=392033 RepID=A0A813Z727_9BILA|nr:unnamed protein product [Rotaria sordida]CAF1050276.1 unnamed protein product [Rotaria sordida]